MCNKSDVKEEKKNDSLCNAQYPRGYLINIDKNDRLHRNNENKK